MSAINRKSAIYGKQLLTDRSVNSLVQYLQEISGPNFDPLNAQEEYDEFIKYRAGDLRAKDKIIKANMRFVVTAAKSYLTYDMKFTNDKAVLEDVIAAGNIGLILALDRYDHTKGFKFLTFAAWYIKLHIGIFLNETLADIRLPANLFRIEKDIAKATSLLKSEMNIDEPSINMVVDKYNQVKDKLAVSLTTGLLTEVRHNKKSFVSSSASISGSRSNGSGQDDDMLLSDTFKQGNEFEPDSDMLKESRFKILDHNLSKKLNEREKLIVEYTFGLAGKEEKTLQQISDITDLTRERIGQILTGAINKLKENKQLFKTILA